MVDRLARFRARRLAAALRDAADVPRGTVAAVHDEVAVVGPVTMEGEPTGDGRVFTPGCFTWQDDPVPIIWDRDDGDHTGQILGTYTEFWRDDDGLLWGRGTLGPTTDDETAASITRVVELMDANAIGQSVRFDQFVAHEETTAVRDDDDGDGEYVIRYDDWLTVFTEARIRHVALVDTPAFDRCRPSLDVGPAAEVAGVSVRRLPAGHFADWTSAAGRDAVPFQVGEDGRVFGHAAGTGCHRSSGPGCLLYTPDVDPTMAGFHTAGAVTLDDGSSVRVGPLTFGGLHADTSMTREQRRAHHEAGSTVVALVRAWDDAYGRLAVAGTLVDGLGSTVVDQLRGCAPSYERWPERGGLTLLGLHMVPVPAHPVATAAAAGGPVVAVDCLCTDGCDVCGRAATSVDNLTSV